MSFIITTSPIIDNRTIAEYLGPLISNEVLGVNIISDSIAGISDFFGGTSGTYRNKLDNLKQSVLNDLRNQATALGADAIIGFSISFNEISGKGKQMFMATATGTAVKLEQNRLVYARKMRELVTLHNEGIFTDAEYEYEVEILKASVENIVAVEVKAIEKQKREEEIARKQFEKEHEEEIKWLKEEKEREEAEREAERLAFQDMHAKILQTIKMSYESHKGDIANLSIDKINSANYDDILPKSDIPHFDIIRYFIALGRADAAGKFYVDKFGLSAQDALDYLSAI